MRTLLAAVMLFMGTLSLGARAAEDPAAAPQCSTTQTDNGGQGLVCNNLTDEQSKQVMSSAQDPAAYVRCFRVCSIRVFRFCLRWHVECQRFPNCGYWGCHGGYGGGYWGGGYGGGYWGGGYHH